MSLELLVFEVDDATFAVPTRNVREVLRAAALFPLAEYPSEVEGGLNLRGVIIPVVDGRAALSRTTRPIVPNDHIIVLDVANQLVAIRVDRAVELTFDDASQSDGRHDGGRLVDRVVNTACGPTAILSVDQLLAVSCPIEAPYAARGSEA